MLSRLEIQANKITARQAEQKTVLTITLLLLQKC